MVLVVLFQKKCPQTMSEGILFLGNDYQKKTTDMAGFEGIC
jgi:hypothetical protein